MNDYEIPKLQEIIPLPEEVKRAEQKGELVLFIGAGISNLLNLPLWEELTNHVLNRACEKGCIDQKKKNQYIANKETPKRTLSYIANFTDFDLKQEIASHLKKLESEYSQKRESENIYDIINKFNCVYVTTNYDKLLNPSQTLATDKRQELERTERTYKREEIRSGLLNESRAIIHLHGCRIKPDSMVVTEKDYLEHYREQNIKKFLNRLFQKTVIFLGYGLGEDGILEAIFKHSLKENRISEPTSEMNLFAIEGFFSGEPYEEKYELYKRTYGIQLLCFNKDIKEYKAIEDTIKDWGEHIAMQPSYTDRDIPALNEIATPPDENSLSSFRLMKRIKEVVGNV